ncbi:hypothetical protein D3C72_1417150 [compost metagenome]
MATGDLVGGGLDDAVGGQQRGGLEEFAQGRGAFDLGVGGRRLGQVDAAVAGLEAAGQRDVARRLRVRPLHGQHLDAVARCLQQLRGSAAADLPGVVYAALVRRAGGVGHRDPDARVGAGILDVDRGGQFEGAPCRGDGGDGRLLGARGVGQRGGGGAQGARETEKVSAVHEAPTHGEEWLSVRPEPGGRPLLHAAIHHRAISRGGAILFRLINGD